MFFKIKHHLPISILICLYNSLVSPFLQYGIVVWGLTHETFIKPVFMLQKRVLKAISFEHSYSHSTPIFLNHKILKLHYLFQVKLLTFVFECMNTTAPSYFHSFFPLVKSVHQYVTRHSSKSNVFVAHRNTLQYGLRTVCDFGAKCWNNIPVEIKSSSSSNTFRQKLKSFLLESNYQ